MTEADPAEGRIRVRARRLSAFAFRAGSVVKNELRREEGRASIFGDETVPLDSRKRNWSKGWDNVISERDSDKTDSETPGIIGVRWHRPPFFRAEVPFPPPPPVAT